MEALLQRTVFPLLRQLARTPPSFRSRFLMRLAWKLSRIVGFKGPIETNMGLSPSFRVLYPDSDHPVAVYGAPKWYSGETGALFLIQALLKECDAFVDIGANLGYFTFFAKIHFPDKPTYFFEPNPQLFDFIERSLEQNRCSNVSGHPQAVGRQTETAAFFIDRQDAERSSLNAKIGFPEGAQEIVTQVVSLSDFAKDLPFQKLLVKVDVENAERDFLEGALGALSKIDCLVMEVLLPAIQGGFLERVLGQGLFAYYINEFQLEHSNDGSFQYAPSEHNWLFCRMDPAQLKKRLQGSRFRVVTKGSKPALAAFMERSTR